MDGQFTEVQDAQGGVGEHRRAELEEPVWACAPPGMTQDDFGKKAGISDVVGSATCQGEIEGIRGLDLGEDDVHDIKIE